MPRSSEQAERRKQALLRLLTDGHHISTEEMARRFDVTPMTIRRDLKAIEQQGLAVRCYGGAVPARRISFEFAFDERHKKNIQQKRRIGSAAASLVEPGHTVFLDTGTTTLEVARALARRAIECSAVTSSLVIASELWANPNIELRLLGGRVRRGSPDLAGPETEATLDRLTADIAFVGSEGVDPERGSFADDHEVARIAEGMARNARRVVVVADSTKLGRAGAVRYLDIDEMAELITDTDADRRQLSCLWSSNVKVTDV